MSRRTCICSQCGQEGHNRRNRECPENVRLRSEAEASTARLNTALNSRVLACVQIVAIEEKISRWENRQLSTRTFLHSVTGNIELECQYISTAMQENLIMDECLAAFKRLVEIVNRIIERHTNERVMIDIIVADRDVTFELTELPMNIIEFYDDEDDNEQTKYTSEYLKEVSLINIPRSDDEDVVCYECPLCFDEVPTPDAIITNCNHSYCTTCIKHLATSIKDNTAKPSCPMCRTEITQLTMGKSQVYNEISEHFSKF